jgi:NAD(P)-dependent dehydrogenase (short-subunit alcohol dehydrogenase family)
MNAEGRTIWITGAASGIGRATALALVGDGARVIVSDRDEAGLSALAAQARVEVEPLDVSRRDDVARVAARIIETQGRLDALVNCAGINVPDRHLDRLSAETWDRIVTINLSGIYYCCHAVLPHLRENGAGTIVTIASWAARNLAWFPGAAYNASKRGLLALTETINLEVVGEGVRASVILPEAVDTPILKQRPGGELPPPEVRAKMLRPEDVASAICWILSLPPHVCVNELQISPISNYHYAGIRSTAPPSTPASGTRA